MTVTGWVALELTGSPWLVAMIGLSRSAFLPLAGPITGALSSRFEPVRMMKIAQWGNVIVIGAVALALHTGHGSYGAIVAATLWLGASWGIDWPNRRSLMADLVGPPLVLNAIVLDNLTQNVSRIVGPLIAGVVLARWGSAGGYTLLAAGFLCASLVLRPVVSSHGMSRSAGSAWRELWSAMRFLRADGAIWSVLAITVVMNCLLFPYQQLLSVFAEDVLHVGPVGLGYLGAANGVGAALGLFVLPAFRGMKWQRLAFVGGSCLACVAMLGFSGSRSFALSLALLVLTGLGTSAFGTMQSSIILSRTDAAMRRRAMGLLAMAIGSAPAGALEVSLLVGRWGAPLAVAVNSALCLALVYLAATRSSGSGGAQAVAANA